MSYSNALFALDVTEIIREILLHLKDSQGPGPTRVFTPGEPQESDAYQACLFNVALACRRFSGPALDLLWERLSSPILLLKLFDSYDRRTKVSVL